MCMCIYVHDMYTCCFYPSHFMTPEGHVDGAPDSSVNNFWGLTSQSAGPQIEMLGACECGLPATDFVAGAFSSALSQRMVCRGNGQ